MEDILDERILVKMKKAEQGTLHENLSLSTIMKILEMNDTRENKEDIKNNYGSYLIKIHFQMIQELTHGIEGIFKQKKELISIVDENYVDYVVSRVMELTKNQSKGK